MKLARRGVFGSEVKSTKEHGTVLTIKQKPEEVATTVTVVLKTNGQIEVAGPIKHPELCMKLLRAGMARVTQYHEQQKERHLIQPAQLVPPGLTPVGEGHA